MRYLKPELLAAEAALEAIRGVKGFIQNDSDGTDTLTDAPAYEVDE